MGRKQKLKMVVKVVPPGALRRNAKNPFVNDSPDKRRDGMIQALAQGLASVSRTPARERTERSPADAGT